MKAIIHKQINGAMVDFEVDEKDLKQAMAFIIPLTESDYCYLDGFQDAKVKWTVRKAKDDSGQTFTYVQKRARNTAGQIASQGLGTYQDGGYFWKKWEVYVPKDIPTPKTYEQEQAMKAKYTSPEQEGIDPSDIPF